MPNVEAEVVAQAGGAAGQREGAGVEAPGRARAGELEHAELDQFTHLFMGKARGRQQLLERHRAVVVGGNQRIVSHGWRLLRTMDGG